MSADNDKAVNEFQTSILMLLRQYTRGCICCTGTIASVDAVKYTCTVNTLNGTYSNVPLSVLKNVQGGDVKLPVVGGDCLITFKNNDTNLPQVLFVNDIDKWYFTANKSYLNGEYYFNNGTVGIPVTNDLVTRLNNVENLLNDLIAKYNIHIHPLSTGTSSPTTTQETGMVTPTVASDIESTKVFNDN